MQGYVGELQSSVGAQSFSFAVMDEEGTTLYSILPRAVRYEVLRSAIAAGPRSVTFCDPGSGKYMVLASPLQGSMEGLWLVSVYDITALYTERDRQLRQYLLLEVTALVLAGTAAAWFSHRMTRPLRALQSAARAMAEGARKASGSDLGIGITGVAGPGGGTPEKPVGLIYIALSAGDETFVRRMTPPGRIHGRGWLRERAASTALDMVRRYLCDLPLEPAAPPSPATPLGT